MNTENDRFLDWNPAVKKRGWLPGGFNPELDEQRARHQEALAAFEGTRAERLALTKKFEAEDEREINAIRKGEERPTDLTSMEDREEARRVAGLKDQVAQEELCDCIREIVRVVSAHEFEWQADLDAREQGSKAIAEEAKAAMEAAEGEVRRMKPLRHWIRRTAKGQDGFHIGITDLGVPEPDLVLDPARISGQAEDPDLTPRPEDDLGPDEAEQATEDDTQPIGVI